MALDATRLAGALKAAADRAETNGPDPLGDPDGFKSYLWEQIAGAIIAEIQQHAEVSTQVALGIPVQVAPATGTGTTTGTGTGTGGIR